MICSSDDAADGQVRFQGLRFLLWLENSDPHVEMAGAVCDALLALDRSMASSKSPGNEPTTLCLHALLQ